MPKNPHADFSPVLNGYSGIGAFRFWCQTALPLTYDDSLSYYELLNKVVNYLNHTIEDLTAVESNTSALANAYDQLQKYVNDYFDDLDVEAELRNVLDAMAEDGTLDALLDPLVENQLPGVVDEKIDAVVADQINDAVAGQIDESVADQLPALVDAGIPEEVSEWLEANVDPVGSAVVVDSTLTISGAAADAKATGDELSKLKKELNNASEKIDVINDFSVTWESGYRKTGATDFDPTTIVEDSNYVTTIIPAKQGDVFYITGHGYPPATLLCVVNMSMGFVVRSSSNSNWVNHAYTFPSQSGFIIVNSTVAAHPTVYKKSIADIQKTVANIDSKIDIINDFVASWSDGYRNTSATDFDPDTIISNSDFVTTKIPAKAGDTFYISGYGRDPAILLCVITENGTFIARSSANIQWQNHTYTCPNGTGYIIVNCYKSVYHSVYKTEMPYILDSIAKIKSSKMFLDPKNKPNIVLLGDSIVQGVGSSDFSATGADLPTTRYPTKRNVGVKCWGNMLVNMLNADYDANVVNNGVAQFHIADITVDINLLCPVGTDTAIVMVGTNNRTSSYADVVTWYEGLINAIANNGTKMIAISPLPVNGATDTLGMSKINLIIETLCEKYGIPFISMYSEFLSYIGENGLTLSDYFSDTLHPNDAGYNIMYNIIRRKLMK